jgi:pimeloyl-ACP methyl ester carboxylesterase
VFVHGVGSTGKVWFAQMRHLKTFGRVIAVNLPGFTGGALPQMIRTLSDLAPWVCQVLDQIGVDQALWVGNSLGGRIAVEAALGTPYRVLGLGLICSAGVRLPGVTVTAPSSVSEEEFNARVFYHPESFTSMQSDAGRQATAEARALYERLASVTEAMDFKEQLHLIDVPTRVIWGRHDGVVPLEIGQAFAEHIPRARLVVLEESAHAPHLEQAEEVNEELESLARELFAEKKTSAFRSKEIK